MSAESAHLSTFGAETETEAEIRSTSNSATCKQSNSSVKIEMLVVLTRSIYSILRVIRVVVY